MSYLFSTLSHLNFAIELSKA